MKASLRRPLDSEFTQWKSLWDQYLVFYETSLADTHAVALWDRLQDRECSIDGLVAEIGGELVGLTHFLPHFDTWDTRLVCYLQDLFVEPEWRGSGVGTSLIRAVVEHSSNQGWSGVYWQTAEDNRAGRSVYDKLTGGASGFIVYQIGTDPPDRL
jgi:GNAT superfamily N-acetyltransferase